MAIPHARSGEVVSVRPLGKSIADARTETLIKTGALEVIRLVASAGKEFAQHQVPGEITLQCLEGVIDVTIGATKRQLSAGDLVYVEGSAPHAVHAVDLAHVRAEFLVDEVLVALVEQVKVVVADRWQERIRVPELPHMPARVGGAELVFEHVGLARDRHLEEAGGICLLHLPRGLRALRDDLATDRTRQERPHHDPGRRARSLPVHSKVGMRLRMSRGQ